MFCNACEMTFPRFHSAKIRLNFAEEFFLNFQQSISPALERRMQRKEYLVWLD